MKTAKEWVHIGGFVQRVVVASKSDIEAIQRDAWEAATKAQMERDGNSNGESYTPAPFPSEAQ